MMPISKRSETISPSPTLAISAKAKEMKKNGIDVVEFGAGEPDFDTPNKIKDAGIEAIKSGFTKYTPASGTVELKKAIIEKFKRDNGLSYDTAQIIVGCGAKHILYNIFQATCDPDDEIIIFSPYWVSYTEMIKLSGAVPVIVETFEEDKFIPKTEAIKKVITAKTKIIVINSPSNPTGAVYPENTLREIAKIAVEKNLIIISDEVYEKMVYNNSKHYSIASFGDEIKNITITVNAASKTYSMTGWRIGYAAGPKEIISAMSKIQSHSTSNPTSISQKAALVALLGNQSDSSLMVKEFAKRRDYVIKRCSEINDISLTPPEGSFYAFINISKVFGKKNNINNSFDFAESLLKEVHVAVVPGGAFGADSYVRLTFATGLGEIKKGFDRIEKFLEG